MGIASRHADPLEERWASVNRKVISGVMVAACAFIAFSAQGCKKSGEASEAREAIKTSFPKDVDPMSPRALKFAEIVAMPAPADVTKNDPRYEKARIPAFANPLGLKEGDVVSVRGYLHRAAYMGDGDYNLRLNDSPSSADGYMVIEIPDYDDVDDKHVRGMIQMARGMVKAQLLSGSEPSKQGSTLQNAPYVEISGQLYFNDRSVGDPPRTDAQGTHRATNWEIHPGISVEVVKPEK